MIEPLGLLVQDELRYLLRARPATSKTSVPQMIRDLGGPAAIARRVHRINGRLPRRGTDARRSYDATIRKYQRAARGGHFADRADLARLQRWHRRIARSPRSRILADGLLARMLITISYSPASAGGQHGEREVPKGGPGAFISPSWCELLLDDYDAGDVDQLGERFWEAFAQDYTWSMPEDALEAIAWLKLWHVDEPEP